MKQQPTDQAILTAARRAFATHGFEGSSVRAITAEARANLGAITYHFGSKRKLYERVLEESVRPLVDAMAAAAHGPGTPGERAADVVRAHFNYLSNHPEVARLMLQELVLGKAPEKTVLPIRDLFAAVSGLVMEGQQSGEFRDGNATIMALGMVSQSLHMNVLRRPLKAFTGIDIDNEAVRAQVVEEVVASVCAALRKT